MSVEKIKEWLSSDRDYQKGVDLFKELNVDATKVPFFENEKPGAIHKNMLAHLLEQHVYVLIETGKAVKKDEKPVKPVINLPGKTNTKDTVKKAEGIVRVLVDDNPIVRLEELPEELQVKYKENKTKYGEIKAYHAEIAALPDDSVNDSKRKELLGLMIEADDLRKANWAAIDAWWKTNKEVNGSGSVEITEASGSYTRDQIEAITDPTIKALCKEKRIAADLAYIRRSGNNEKKKDEVNLRIAELKAWEVNYEERIGKNSSSDPGK